MSGHAELRGAPWLGGRWQPLLGLPVAAGTFVVAARGLLGSPGRVALLVAGLVVVVGLVVTAVRAPGWLPAALVLLASLVPYQVSFVGKTPFGVVSATGALAAVALTALVVAHGRTHPELLRGPEVAAFAAWLALMVASSLLAPDYRIPLNTVRVIAVAMPLAFLCGRLASALDPLALQRAVVVIGLISVLAVAEELTHLSPYDLVPSSGFPLVPPPAAVRSGLIRVRLGYYHGSTLGTVLAVALPLVVARRRALSTRALRWVLPALLAAMVWTLTFQVWLASLVALALLGLGLARLRVGMVAGLMAGSLLLASGVVPAVNQLVEDRLHPSGSAADEFAFREQLYPAALQYAAHGPVLGAGPGQFNALALRGTVRGRSVQLVDDNTFTSKLAETGFPGLALLLLALLLVARQLAANAERWRAWAGLAALAAWTVMAMSVELLLSDQNLLPCWLMIGLLSYSPARQPA